MLTAMKITGGGNTNGTSIRRAPASGAVLMPEVGETLDKFLN